MRASRVVSIIVLILLAGVSIRSVWGGPELAPDGGEVSQVIADEEAEIVSDDIVAVNSVPTRAPKYIRVKALFYSFLFVLPLVALLMIAVYMVYFYKRMQLRSPIVDAHPEH